MIECQICGHPGVHAVVVYAALPTRCDQCSRCVAEPAAE